MLLCSYSIQFDRLVQKDWIKTNRKEKKKWKILQEKVIVVEL